jgi:hypothetical protein
MPREKIRACRALRAGLIFGNPLSRTRRPRLVGASASAPGARPREFHDKRHPPNGGIMSPKIAFRDITDRATTNLGRGQWSPIPEP